MKWKIRKIVHQKMKRKQGGGKNKQNQWTKMQIFQNFLSESSLSIYKDLNNSTVKNSMINYKFNAEKWNNGKELIKNSILLV